MEIYHGSNIAVKEPIAYAGRRNLDFGKGFYTTRIKSQAQKWAFLVAKPQSANGGFEPCMGPHVRATAQALAGCHASFCLTLHEEA